MNSLCIICLGHDTDFTKLCYLETCDAVCCINCIDSLKNYYMSHETKCLLCKSKINDNISQGIDIENIVITVHELEERVEYLANMSCYQKYGFLGLLLFLKYFGCIMFILLIILLYVYYS